jgi:CRP-like cAMP-binding protein
VKAIATYLQAMGIHLSPELRRQLGEFRLRIMTKGDYFVREGQTAQSLAFVLRGKVRHYYTIDGKEFTRWVSLSGNFTAAFKSFVEQTPSKSNLVCLEEVEMLWIGRDEFFGTLLAYDEIQRFWMRCLEAEMIKYEDRVTQLITADSTARYLNFVANYPAHAQQVPLKYIASMLGVEPRHLSRIRRNLARR